MFDDRISIEPFPARRGQKVNITYRGLLAKSGADAVWMHYGYDGWKSLGWAQMSKLPDGSFVANIDANGTREINFCFKDSANNWDNNSGWNWSCAIS